MDLVFVGTPKFALPTLQVLHRAGHGVRAVFTQPDQPAGRGGRLTAPPVKRVAVALGLPVHQPARIRSPEVFDLLKSLEPEAVVVVGYGKILPQRILDLPRYGCINLHASLLPKYRGAAPVQWAIIRGETVTGVTTMRMDAGLDTGDILLARETPIEPEEDAISMGHRLAEMGASLVLETLDGLQRGTLTPLPQDHDQATSAPMLKKEHGRMDWSLPALDIANRVRGLVPWPGAFTTFRDGLLHVWRARPELATPLHSSLTPGTVQPGTIQLGTIEKAGRRLLVACGQGSWLEIQEVQREGRRRLSAAEFLNGARVASGEHLG